MAKNIGKKMVQYQEQIWGLSSRWCHLSRWDFYHHFNV